MKNNLQQLQEEKWSLFIKNMTEFEPDYIKNHMNKSMEEAYNQGVKDSVEALPKYQHSFEEGVVYGTGFNTCGAISRENINKLKQ